MVYFVLNDEIIDIVSKMSMKIGYYTYFYSKKWFLEIASSG